MRAYNLWASWWRRVGIVASWRHINPVVSHPVFLHRSTMGWQSAQVSRLADWQTGRLASPNATLRQETLHDRIAERHT